MMVCNDRCVFPKETQLGDEPHPWARYKARADSASPFAFNGLSVPFA